MCSGVAWVVDVKKIDAKMEVLEVASIGRTTERADSSEKNIINTWMVDVDFVADAPRTIETWGGVRCANGLIPL